MNLLNWFIDPIRDLMSFIHFGSLKFLIASDLCVKGSFPKLVNLEPSHLISCVKKLQFSQLMDRPS